MIERLQYSTRERTVLGAVAIFTRVVLNGVFLYGLVVLSLLRGLAFALCAVILWPGRVKGSRDTRVEARQ